MSTAAFFFIFAPRKRAASTSVFRRMSNTCDSQAPIGIRTHFQASFEWLKPWRRMWNKWEFNVESAVFLVSLCPLRILSQISAHLGPWEDAVYKVCVTSAVEAGCRCVVWMVMCMHDCFCVPVEWPCASCGVASCGSSAFNVKSAEYLNGHLIWKYLTLVCNPTYSL